jgi:hypothetical protein
MAEVSDAALTTEQLLENARTLRPVVRERKLQGDADRRVPEEMVENFRRDWRGEQGADQSDRSAMAARSSSVNTKE